MSQRVRSVSLDEAATAPPDPDIDDETFSEVLAQMVKAFGNAGVPFVLFGGLGSALLGRPRWTHDIDAFIKPEWAKRALVALADAGFATEERDPDWLFKAYAHDVMVDLVFRAKGGVVLDDEMLRRARNLEFGGVRVPVISPEDLVVIKAVVHDEHMPRHWHDAVAIVAMHDLDWDYLVRRARQQGIARVLSLLLYARSNDLAVPLGPLRRLFDAVCAE